MKLRLLCVPPADQVLNRLSWSGSFHLSQLTGPSHKLADLQQLLPVTVTPHGRRDSEKLSRSETHTFF